MKKTVLLFLLVLGANAFAEDLRPVTESDTVAIKVDVDSISKAGKYKKAWSVFNYPVSARAPGTKFSFISDRSLFYFDCQRKRYGRATQILHAQPDGIGESLTTFSGKMNDIKFERVSPGNMDEILLNFVCLYSGS